MAWITNLIIWALILIVILSTIVLLFVLYSLAYTLPAPNYNGRTSRRRRRSMVTLTSRNTLLNARPSGSVLKGIIYPFSSQSRQRRSRLAKYMDWLDSAEDEDHAARRLTDELEEIQGVSSAVYSAPDDAPAPRKRRGDKKEEEGKTVTYRLVFSRPAPPNLKGCLKEPSPPLYKEVIPFITKNPEKRKSVADASHAVTVEDAVEENIATVRRVTLVDSEDKYFLKLLREKWDAIQAAPHGGVGGYRKTSELYEKRCLRKSSKEPSTTVTTMTKKSQVKKTLTSKLKQKRLAAAYTSHSSDSSESEFEDTPGLKPVNPIITVVDEGDVVDQEGFFDEDDEWDEQEPEDNEMPMISPPNSPTKLIAKGISLRESNSPNRRSQLSAQKRSMSPNANLRSASPAVTLGSRRAAGRVTARRVRANSNTSNSSMGSANTLSPPTSPLLDEFPFEDNDDDWDETSFEEPQSEPRAPFPTPEKSARLSSKQLSSLLPAFDLDRIESYRTLSVKDPVNS